MSYLNCDLLQSERLGSWAEGRASLFDDVSEANEEFCRVPQLKTQRERIAKTARL